MCLCFLQLQWLLNYYQCCDFSQNKSCKTYLGPMLPPGSRNWQLISHIELDLFGQIIEQGDQIGQTIAICATFQSSRQILGKNSSPKSGKILGHFTVNLGIPQAAAKHELLFNKPATRCLLATISHFHPSLLYPCMARSLTCPPFNNKS